MVAVLHRGVRRAAAVLLLGGAGLATSAGAPPAGAQDFPPPSAARVAACADLVVVRRQSIAQIPIELRQRLGYQVEQVEETCRAFGPEAPQTTRALTVLDSAIAQGRYAAQRLRQLHQRRP